MCMSMMVVLFEMTQHGQDEFHLWKTKFASLSSELATKGFVIKSGWNRSFNDYIKKKGDIADVVSNKLVDLKNDGEMVNFPEYDFNDGTASFRSIAPKVKGLPTFVRDVASTSTAKTELNLENNYNACMFEYSDDDEDEMMTNARALTEAGVTFTDDELIQMGLDPFSVRQIERGISEDGEPLNDIDASEESVS